MEGNDSSSESDSEERRLQHAEWLRNVITERKGIKEKLRTKAWNQLLVDREKIRAFDAGPEDGLDPVKIFPKEIWAMILDQVKDPDTLESAWRTCNLFREFLDTRRLEEVVLPTVFQIPLLLDLLDEEDEEEVDDVQGPQPPPLLQGREVGDVDGEEGRENMVEAVRNNVGATVEYHQTWSPIIKVRNVCKSWKKGLDLSIQKHLMKSVPRNSLTLYRFDRSPDHFVEGLSFFCRAVRASCYMDYDHPPLIPLMCDLNFFKFAGSQILAFDVKFQYLCQHSLDANLVITKLLEMTPNVISLSVDSQATDQGGYPENLNRVLELNPISKLSFVDRLRLKTESKFLNSRPRLYHRFLQACPNVTVLVLDCEIRFADEAYHANTKPLGKIAEAVRSLAHVTSFNLINASAHDSIEEVFSKEWKLNHVHVSTSISLQSGTKIVERLFASLESYKETLETAELSFGSVDGTEDDSDEPAFLSTDLKLNLPNVKKLRLEIRDVNHWPSLDFLFPLARLEHLELVQQRNMLRLLLLHNWVRQYDDAIIKFLNDRGEWDLYGPDSNVWQVFPALKTLVIRAEAKCLDWNHPRKWEVTEFTRHGGKRVFYQRSLCDMCDRDVPCICSYY